MVSKRQAEAFRARLAAGETIVLSARVDAKMVPATYDVVVATIPGTDPASGEVVLTAHLCHQSAGANDNASGSAAILEVGRALAAAIRRRTLPAEADDPIPLAPRDLGLPGLPRPPPRARRRASSPESTWTWSGGLLSTTKGTFHLSRTAESLPHVVNPIAAAWFAQVQAASAALRGRARRRRLRRLRLASGIARALRRRRARDRDGQRPRGLRGGGLPDPDGVLPRLPRRHDPHPEGPAREPRRDEARPRRVHGRGNRLDTRSPARLGGQGPARRHARGGRAARPGSRRRAGARPGPCGARSDRAGRRDARIARAALAVDRARRLRRRRASAGGHASAPAHVGSARPGARGDDRRCP